MRFGFAAALVATFVSSHAFSWGTAPLTSTAPTTTTTTTTTTAPVKTVAPMTTTTTTQPVHTVAPLPGPHASPAPNPFKDVKECKANPPRPGDGGWGDCPAAVSPDKVKGYTCKAHTHDKNEVAHQCQTDSNIEVHIKCGFPEEHHGAASDHSYGVFVVNVSCEGVEDNSVTPPDANGSIDVTPPGCAGKQQCCRGGLTNDADRQFCMDPANANHAKCNNIFTLCGEGNSGASLTKEAIASFCANRKKCTQPACDYDLVNGELRCMEYKDAAPAK